jgi:hypothetical protein
MAKKKTKRKTYRARARSVGRRVGRRLKRGRGRSKTVPLPMKLAVGIGIGVPVAATVLAGAKVFFDPQPILALPGNDLSFFERLHLTIAVASDDFTDGWGMGRPFGQVMITRGVSGYAVNTKQWQVMPTGGSMKLGIAALTAGGLASVVSWVGRKMAGVKQVKIAGQRVG